MDRLLKNNQDGFTLTEMLISMAIFSIGMLAVISMFTTSFSALRFVRNLSNANGLGQQMMETLSSPDVESGGVATGMGAIVNSLYGTPNANIINVTTTYIKAEWPDPNSDIKYDIDVNLDTYAVTGSISATIANVVISWDEMGTTKFIYFQSLFD
jgi:prepilin-type N-terminal cleavage/methylation domain-containing protein